MSITLEEFKKERADKEDQISKIISEFQMKHKVFVKSVELLPVHNIAAKQPIRTDVKFEIDIL
ncbi:hypothetical protein KA005_72240 [bacterium]|nr:hypothetical protein [bacterium]